MIPHDTLNCSLRAAALQDAAIVAECFVLASRFLKRECPGDHTKNLPEAADSSLLGHVEKLLASPDAVALLAEIDGKMTGCAVAQITQTMFPPSNIGLVGCIQLCWVAPEARRQGICSQLVGAVETWARERGARIVELAYLADNSLAKKAWNRLGYAPFRIQACKSLEKK